MRMTLVDTSVWIDHLRSANAELGDLLAAERVLIHPFVIGEIALGSFSKRAILLEQLGALPMSRVASAAEILRLIESRRLWGAGLGYVDVHLLASMTLTPNAILWSRDKRLQDAATRLNVVAMTPRR